MTRNPTQRMVLLSAPMCQAPNQGSGLQLASHCWELPSDKSRPKNLKDQPSRFALNTLLQSCVVDSVPAAQTFSTLGEIKMLYTCHDQTEFGRACSEVVWYLQSPYYWTRYQVSRYADPDHRAVHALLVHCTCELAIWWQHVRPSYPNHCQDLAHPPLLCWYLCSIWYHQCSLLLWLHKFCSCGMSCSQGWDGRRGRASPEASWRTQYSGRCKNVCTLFCPA